MRAFEVDLNYDPESESQSASPSGDGKLPPKLRWFAAPNPSVYVCATSRELLEVIIGRMKTRGTCRALPATLCEWRQVDPVWPAWGLRHYRAASKKKDATSMLRWDPGAEGLVFFGSKAPDDFLGLRYLSKTEDADRRILDMQRAWFGKFPIREEHLRHLPAWECVSPGCFESRMRINVSLEEVQGKPLMNQTVQATFFFCMDSVYLPWMGFPGGLPPWSSGN